MEKTVTLLKVDESLGLVFGWAVICKEGDKDYVDVQGDHAPEASMLDAATDFMQNSRVAKDMHRGDKIGDVVFGFPMTTEVAKALEITTPRTGFLIAMKPSAAVLAQFKKGDYTGFSIGGSVIKAD